jgi:hypothetical protein
MKIFLCILNWKDKKKILHLLFICENVQDFWIVVCIYEILKWIIGNSQKRS